MKNLKKFVLRNDEDLRLLSLFDPDFNSVLFYLDNKELRPRFIKVVTSDNKVLECYKDKHNNYIYREYEKN